MIIIILILILILLIGHQSPFQPSQIYYPLTLVKIKNRHLFIYFQFIEITASDLESFAKHAKRSTINQDDVKLLGRRNETLEKEISEFILKKEKE